MPKFFAAFLACMCLASAAVADRVVVFAASSLKGALDEVAVLWGARSGHEAVVSYGGSGAMAQQILRGAPANVFISANPDWMDAVAAAGGVAPASRVDLLGNALVLIGPSGAEQIALDSPGAAAQISARLAGERLAVGQVESVPAGIYARAALEHLGLWPGLAPQLLQVDRVSSVARLVALGDAPLGIAYLTDVVAPDGTPVLAVVATFPAASHGDITYPAALTAEAPQAAADFLAFLQGPEATEIFTRFGFRVPGA